MTDPKKSQLIKYTLGLGGLSLISALNAYIFADSAISNYYNDDNLLPFRRLARSLTDIGLSENFFVLSLAVFLVAHWFQKKSKNNPRIQLKTTLAWLKTWSLNFFVCLISSGVILHLFKFLVGRQRPHVSDTFQHNIFHFLEFNSHHQSLPSGHSQVLFTSATMFCLLWPRASWVIYVIAALLALTRVVVHAHFLSDVILGAAVGHLATLWSLWYLEKRYPKRFSLSK